MHSDPNHIYYTVAPISPIFFSYSTHWYLRTYSNSRQPIQAILGLFRKLPSCIPSWLELIRDKSQIPEPSHKDLMQDVCIRVNYREESCIPPMGLSWQRGRKTQQ